MLTQNLVYQSKVFKKEKKKKKSEHYLVFALFSIFICQMLKRESFINILMQVNPTQLSDSNTIRLIALTSLTIFRCENE